LEITKLRSSLFYLHTHKSGIVFNLPKHVLDKGVPPLSLRGIFQSPSPGAAHAGWALRTLLLGGPSAAAGAAAAVAAATTSSSASQPAPGIGNLGPTAGGGFGAAGFGAAGFGAGGATAATGPVLRDRRGMRNVASGAALVDWLMAISAGTVRKREQAAAMWQVLVEEGVLLHGKEKDFRGNIQIW